MKKMLFALCMIGSFTSTISNAQSILQTNAVPTRAMGNINAPEVDEWLSLTCTHCAKFQEEVLPKIKKEYIDTGKIYYVVHDFPMDHLGLIAAAVSRKVPEKTYFAFIDNLLKTQENWAFGADPKNIYSKIKIQATMTGMSGEDFDNIVKDKNYLKVFIQEGENATNKYHINGTPAFRFPDGTMSSGEISYDEFKKHLNIK